MFGALNLFYISLLFLILGGLFAIKSSAFTIEELSAVKYEVEMSMYPLEREEYQAFSVMLMTTSFGEEFHCMLPQIKEEDVTEKIVGENEMSIDIKELLKPMYAGDCLYKVKDWWIYELCFGQAIKQFHVEDGKIIGRVLTLGYYESDYERNNDIDEKKFKNEKQPYHYQSYVNGTKCDLTGLPRTAEVRIFCEEDSLDYINWVHEPATCNYVITVHTSLLCSHFRSKSSKKAHKIPCHPLFNDKRDAYELEKVDMLNMNPEGHNYVWKKN